ncbi:MAG: YciI family protein [Candidatus Dormiibacterota bacterium]
MAQYAIFLYSPNVDIDEDPEPGELEKHDRYADDLKSSGTLIAAFPLQPITASTSIRSDGLADGPFIEAKEVVVGVYVIEAADLDDALKTAERNPILTQGGGLEVRPVAT